MIIDLDNHVANLLLPGTPSPGNRCHPVSRCRRAGRCADGSAKKWPWPRAPCAVSVLAKKKDEKQELLSQRCDAGAYRGHGTLRPCRPRPATIEFQTARISYQR